MFIPVNGYFARYLEILANPGASPITVDVNLASGLYGGRNEFCSGGFNFCRNAHFISTTSSGDVTIDVSGDTPDRWVTLGGSGFQPYVNSNHALSVSFTFDGEGAPLRAAGAGYVATGVHSPQNGGYPQFTVNWQSVTIPAGETVTLMHFVSLQENAQGATGSAERLVQLPPEALEGLAPDEIASVQNFLVPTDGTSTLAPLPALTGTVSGRVFEGDAQTLVPNGTVEFRSDLPMYPRRLLFGVNSAGAFSFTGALGAPVPMAPFTLRGMYPGRQNQASPSTAGLFEAGTTTTTADVVFSDSGIMTGVVRRTNGTPVPGAIVEIPFIATATTDASGRYRFGGVQETPTRVLRGNLPRPQGDGTPLSIVQQVFEVTAGQTRDDVLFLEPSGTVTGIVRDANGNLQSGRLVTVRTADNQFQRSAQTDTSGRYTFSDVRIGALVLSSTDPTNGLPVTANVTLAADATVTQDLTYTGIITMQVLVTRASGAPLSGMTVQVSGTGFTTQTATTGTDGVASLPNIPAGRAATVTAFHPNSSTLLRTTRAITTGALTISQTLALPAFGTISGTIERPNGTLAGSGIRVRVMRVSDGSTIPTTPATPTTNAASQYTIPLVPAGMAVALMVEHPSATIDGSRPELATPTMVTADGQALTINSAYPAVAQLTITVQENGVPVSGASVQEARVASNGSIFYTSRGTTNASGVLVIAQVAEGLHNYRIQRPSSTTVLETASVTIVRAHDGGNVNLLVDAKLFNVTVRGMLYEADGVTPLNSSGQIELRRGGDGALLSTTFVSSTTPGLFTFTNFDATLATGGSGTGKSTGAGLIVRARQPFQPFKAPYLEQLLVPTQNGEMQVSFTMPVRRATVSGRVLTTDGQPVGAGAVTLDLVSDASAQISSGPAVSADGTWNWGSNYYPVEGVRAKLWNIRGITDGTVQVVSEPITQRDQAVSLDLVVPADVLFKRVTGTVVAGDGATPISGSFVQLASSVPNCCSMSTGNDGAFSFGVAFPPDAPLTVTAQFSSQPPVSLAKSFTAAPGGTDIDAGTFVLPLSILKGTVTFGGVRPVEYPDVFVRNASNQVTWATESNGDGTYRFVGLAPGTYTLVVEASGTGLSTTRTVTIASTESNVTEDVELPLVGQVIVQVFDRFNNQVFLEAPSRVALIDAAGTFERYCSDGDDVSFSNGICYFDGVQPGAYIAQVELESCDTDDDCSPIYGTASGVLSDTTVPLTLNIRLNTQGHLRVSTDPDWVGAREIPEGTPMRMTVRATGADGPLGTVTRVRMFEASESAETLTFNNIPRGGALSVTVERYHEDWDGWEGIVRVSTFVNAGQITNLDLVGAHWDSGSPWYALTGDDGWYYSIAGGGELRDAAKYTPSWSPLYNGAIDRLNQLEVNGVIAPDAPALSRFDSYVQTGPNSWARDWSEVTIGPYSNTSPVSVLRKVYQPKEGGFVRYVDTFFNPTNVPITVTLKLRTQPNPGGTFSTSPGSSPLYVVYNNSSTNRANVGVVLAGTFLSGGPSLSLTGGQQVVTQTFTVPPNSDVSFMSFVVLREPSQLSALNSAVQSLTNPLSVPRALLGLSRADRAKIINFVLMPVQ